MVVAGFKTVDEEFKYGKLSSHQRLDIIRAIVEGLRRLQNKRILYTDFHMQNVMTDTAGQLVWMDTGVTVYAPFSKKSLLVKIIMPLGDLYDSMVIATFLTKKKT